MATVVIEADVEERPPTRVELEALAPEFAARYEAHSRQIFYLCLRLLGDPTKAEDATHDVFLKAWRRQDQFRGDSSWRTWVYRIAINHCHNLQRAWSERHIQPAADQALLENTVADADSPLRAGTEGTRRTYPDHAGPPAPRIPP